MALSILNFIVQHTIWNIKWFDTALKYFDFGGKMVIMLILLWLLPLMLSAATELKGDK